MKIQQYHRATSLEDAYNVLMANPKNHILGGALWLKQLDREIETAIDLQDLKLDEISQSETHFRIGSMTTLYRLESAEALNEWCDQLVRSAMQHIMGVSFRHSATLGGSIMGRYAFSDLIGVFLVLEAELEFHKTGKMSLETFLHERKMPNDILVAIYIPKQKGKSFFKKVSNTRLDFAILNFAFFKTDDQLRIAIGSRPSIAMLAKETMAFINASGWNDDTKPQALELFMNEVSFGNNQRGSAEYRKQLAKVYFMRGVEEVMKGDC